MYFRSLVPIGCKGHVENSKIIGVEVTVMFNLEAHLVLIP